MIGQGGYSVRGGFVGRIDGSSDESSPTFLSCLSDQAFRMIFCFFHGECLERAVDSLDEECYQGIPVSGLDDASPFAVSRGSVDML